MATRLTFLFLLVVGVAAPQQQVPSTLIAGAAVVDGTGAPGRYVDVRIVGDKSSAISTLRRSPTDVVIDGKGMVLAPGFIDTHSHHDRGLNEQRDALGAVSQGITTIVVGQDGGSSVPLKEAYARLESNPTAVNVASYVGHGTLRRRVMAQDFK